jgi:hypothetical protein
MKLTILSIAVGLLALCSFVVGVLDENVYSRGLFTLSGAALTYAISFIRGITAGEDYILSKLEAQRKELMSWMESQKSDAENKTNLVN